jgi:hypothetical protein
MRSALPFPRAWLTLVCASVGGILGLKVAESMDLPASSTQKPMITMKRLLWTT